MKNKFYAAFMLVFALLLGVVSPVLAVESTEVAASGTGSDSKSVTEDTYVDLGGYKYFTHLESKNTIHNKPTVVFESGYGQGYEAWRFVQPKVAEFATTVSYDRGSIGNSDPTTNPRDAVGIAGELHAVLEKLALPKPYILVGHSMGGQYIREFQALYPDEVAGLVTVDGTVDTLDQDIVPFWDPEFAEIYKTWLPPEFGTYVDITASSDQVRANRSALANVPLTVLCAEYQIGPMSPPEDQELLPYFNAEITDPKWKELQQSLASESTMGKFVYVLESAHEINLYKPDVIVNEILLLLQSLEDEQ